MTIVRQVRRRRALAIAKKCIGKSLRVAGEHGESGCLEALHSDNRAYTPGKIIANLASVINVQKRLHQIDAGFSATVQSGKLCGRAALARRIRHDRLAAVPFRVHAAAAVEDDRQGATVRELPVFADERNREGVIVAVILTFAQRKRTKLATDAARRLVGARRAEYRQADLPLIIREHR